VRMLDEAADVERDARVEEHGVRHRHLELMAEVVRVLELDVERANRGPPSNAPLAGMIEA
jgi:hypothetical protein